MTGGTSSDLARKVVSALDLPTALRGPRTDFDKYRLQSDPSLLRTVVAELSALIQPAVEILGGLHDSKRHRPTLSH